MPANSHLFSAARDCTGVKLPTAFSGFPPPATPFRGGIMRKLALFFVLLAFVSLASAGTFTSVVAYGDSLSDNGNLFAAIGQPGAPYYNGRRSNGPVAVENLATILGVPLHDFAWIGATTGIGNYADGGTPTSLGFGPLPGMGVEFESTKALVPGLAASGALFVVWGGPNDFLSPSPLDANALEVANRAAADIIGIVLGLQALGAQNILVPGMPDLGLTPYFNAIGQSAGGSIITDYFNAKLRCNLLRHRRPDAHHCGQSCGLRLHQRN
jgi:phospholipase/lecithinase/hemolysin